MTLLIKGGGLFVIAAVLGMFAFVIWQVLPLFRGASVEMERTVQLPAALHQVLGIDEWSQFAYAVEPDGKLHFVDLVNGSPPREAELGFEADIRISAVGYNPQSRRLICGTADGRFALVDVRYSRTVADGKEQSLPQASAGSLYRVAPENATVRSIAYGDSGLDKLAVAIVDVDGESRIHAATLKQTKSLIGAGKVSVGNQFDLTQKVPGRPVRILVNNHASTILVTTDDGAVHFLERKGNSIEPVQVFRPFADQPDQKIGSIDFLLGEVSISVSNSSGAHRVYSLLIPEGSARRLFVHTKTFPQLPGAITSFCGSSINRAFLVASGSFVSLRFSTTESIRWETNLPFTVRHAFLSGKYDKILLLDDANQMHIYRLQDKHPEASWRALFGKVWYEGYARPGYEWQSSGGSDEFEPKLSLIPLIAGTLKATLYAMLFSVPIAIFAAIYTSQFLDPSIRRIVKPAMEIMASLPSVVLGFLGALWLAPILETRIPSVLAIVILVPAAAAFLGWSWAGLPIKYRVLVKPGYEFVAFLPVLLCAGWAGWQMGPLLERTFFVITDPATGATIADFRRWWPAATHLSFEQRNSLIVGIMMGFAVIPIVFTITEDALSNVPLTLRSASLALGASRWQTTLRVVLPTASAGIFSACMIGLGRAVGETMIVVMATGNTPLMSLNIFSGMRTLSANIAVELPEAPFEGTLFRTLFLSAVVLFAMTFVVNTVAEILRQHLRERYKTV